MLSRHTPCYVHPSAVCGWVVVLVAGSADWLVVHDDVTFSERTRPWVFRLLPREHLLRCSLQVVVVTAHDTCWIVIDRPHIISHPSPFDNDIPPTLIRRAFLAQFPPPKPGHACRFSLYIYSSFISQLLHDTTSLPHYYTTSGFGSIHAQYDPVDIRIYNYMYLPL